MRRLQLLLFYVVIFALAPIVSMSGLKAQQADTANFPYWIEMMQQQDANFFETQRAFETYWEGREITRGSGYKPFKRWEYMMKQRVSPEGQKPDYDMALKAYNKIVESGAVIKNRGSEWVQMGPFDVPSGNNGYRGLGRVNAIAFDPVNPDILYVGAPAGGLWVSYNHGTTWQVLTDHLPTLGVSAILVDYSNPNHILIGTGDRDAGDAPGLGVWRSTDGGQNWEQWNNGMGSSIVGRMVQDPLDPQVMLAAASSGVYRTINGGETWALSRNGNFKEVVLHPTNSNIVYAAQGGNFYRSDDNGVSFALVNNGLPGGSRTVIGVSPAAPDVVYCLITTSDAFKGLYRSTDAGLSFAMKSNSPNIMSWDCNGGSGGQAWYDLDIAVEPTNADVIYAGGVNCFKSTDGGTSWNIRSHWYGGCGVQSVHADLHILEYSPINNQLYVGNDGGIYFTANGGVNWTELSNGLVISQAYKIGQSKTKTNYVINGYQDNGSSVVNNTTWVAVGGGDGMECAYDPADERYSYSTLYYGEISRNFNNNYQGTIAGEGSNGITEGGGWVTPFLIDHNDGNVMFIGYKNIWRSTNIKAGNTSSVQWQKISTMNNSNMDQLAQSKANTNILYASSGKKFYFTENAKDATVEWAVRTNALPTNANITAIETHPTNEEVVYIAQQNQIFKSQDKGLTWTDISLNLSSIQINSIAYYKNSQEGLYIGTDVGVFYKEASMDQWYLYNEGLPASVNATEVEIYYDAESPQNDLIRVGTYGRGLWSASPFIGSLTAGISPSVSNVSAGCDVNFTDQTIGTPFSWEWTFSGGEPSTSSQQNPQGIVYAYEGVFDVTLTVTNSLGSDTFVCEDCITVGPAAVPEVGFSASATVGCAGMIVRFTDQTGNCPNLWEWEFIPNSVSFLENTTNNSQNPVVQFNENVPYHVLLTAANETGTNTLLMSDMIHVGGLTIPFVENFETPSFVDAGWSVVNPDDGRSWTLTTLPDGNKAAVMEFFSYTNFQQRDYLVSPPLDFSGMQPVGLTFKYAYAQRYFQMDSLIVGVSTDCGETWQRVYANGPNGEGIFETSLPTLASFVPQSDEDWCFAGDYGASCPEINLGTFAGMSGIKIRFETYNQYGNNLYINDVMLSPYTELEENVSLENTFALYPNPAHGQVKLLISNNLLGKSLLFADVHGKLVKKITITSHQMDIALERLPAGVYQISIEGQPGQLRKLIVI